MFSRSKLSVFIAVSIVIISGSALLAFGQPAAGPKEDQPEALELIEVVPEPEILSRSKGATAIAQAFGLNQVAQRTILNRLEYLALTTNLPFSDSATDPLTQMELAQGIALALGLDRIPLDLSSVETSHSDLPSDHPAFAAMYFLRKVEDTESAPLVHPRTEVSEEELKATLERVAAVSIQEGTVTQVDLSTNAIIATTTPGRHIYFVVTDDTSLYFNGQPATISEIQADDQITALFLESQTLGWLAATGDRPTFMDTIRQVSQEDVAAIGEELVTILREIITPDQLAAIIQGDWSEVSEAIQEDLQQRLLELGLSPWEVEAFLEQDWTNLQSMGKDRVASSASERLQLSPEMVYAALEQNWDQLLQFVQLELAQRLLAGLL